LEIPPEFTRLSDKFSIHMQMVISVSEMETLLQQIELQRPWI